MERFISLTVIDKDGREWERRFNTRYIKSYGVATKTVLLAGNIKPFLVTDESMKRLQKMFGSDEGDR